MIELLTADTIESQTLDASAAVWINGRRAIVALMDRDGRISTSEISRWRWSESSYLAKVVRVIGDRRRVVILGPSSVRLALEREYVAIFQRPDRLIDVEASGPIDADALLDRLRTLGA